MVAEGKKLFLCLEVLVLMDRNLLPEGLWYTRDTSWTQNITDTEHERSSHAQAFSTGVCVCVCACVCVYSLTDGEHVWMKDYSDEELKDFLKKHSMTSTTDYIQHLRVSCSEGDLSVCVSDAAHVLFGRTDLVLSKINECGSKQELKELMFRMAEQLTDGEPPSVSEQQEAQRKPIDFQPQQQQSRASSQVVKRRRPGASLINPGAKRKPDATGVAFNDADDED
ncbi:protein PAXX-like isoform X1 [Gouania willdenowi]|nr:protein PAXX-like isoform X1 [Gouania willdenowi]XP_028314402.1 protein PAXX-like isoform X1 [Gouania willdenowi]